MGFLSKLFGKSEQPTQSRNKADRRTNLEKIVDNITPASMNEDVKMFANPEKVPYAQAMTVLLFSRVFTRDLRDFFEELPEPFKTNWPFPHDRVFAEVAAFYYFVLLHDCSPEPSEEDDWNARDEDEKLDDGPSDPYCDSLNTSLYICSRSVYSFMDKAIHEHYVINRANSYLPLHRGKNRGAVEKLVEHIMDVWNPNPEGTSLFDLLSAIGELQLYGFVIKMPLDDVIAACRGLYEEKTRDPKAF